MCIITNPKDFFEPVSVLRIITWNEDGFLEGQFYGRHTFEWYIDRRLAKFPFQPAWYQPSDERFYYLPKPLHSSHRPFTNILSEEKSFNIRNIVAFGFHLQKDLKIPRAVVKIALDAWRIMVFEKDAVGAPTFEAKDDDLEDLRS